MEPKMKRSFLLAMLGVVSPIGAAAQSFDGAFVSIETIGYPSNSNVGGVSYSGGAELSFGTSLGVSADLTIYNDEALYSNITSSTVHAFFRPNSFAAIGAFYGAETYKELNNTLNGTFYGVEGRTSLDGIRIEAFWGESEGEVSEGSMFGISGGYMFSSFGIAADYSVFDAGELSVDRLSITGEWALDRGPILYAGLGRLGGEFEDQRETEDFISLGVKIGMGPRAGTTFGPRSSAEVILGP